MNDDRLFPSTTTLDQGANFVASRSGQLALGKAHDAVAERWLRGHVDADATWLGDSLAVEINYFPALAGAIIAAGFLFERDPLHNWPLWPEPDLFDALVAGPRTGSGWRSDMTGSANLRTAFCHKQGG